MRAFFQRSSRLFDQPIDLGPRLLLVLAAVALLFTFAVFPAAPAFGLTNRYPCISWCSAEQKFVQ